MIYFNQILFNFFFNFNFSANYTYCLDQLQWLIRVDSHLICQFYAYKISMSQKLYGKEMNDSYVLEDTSASRVHLMYLLLLANLNNASNFSWGSAVLASLYRALDHEVDYNQENIGGCMLLLQCWAWDRIKCLSPSFPPLSAEEIDAGVGYPLAKR